MSNFTYWSKSEAAAEFTKKLASFAIHISNTAPCSVTIESNIGNVAVGQSRAEAIDATAKKWVEKFAKCPAAEIVRASVETNDSALKYVREAFGGKFTLERSGGAMTPDAVLNHLSERFVILPQSQLINSHLPETERVALQHLEATQMSLGAVAAKIIQTGAEQTLELQKQIQTVSQTLEEDFQERRRLLEDEHRNKNDALKQERSAFEEQQKQYELRENTAIRRKLLNDILERHSTESEFKFSATTKSQSRHVVVAFAILLLTALAVIVVMLARLSFGAKDWHDYASLGVAFALFATTGIYFIRWNDRYFRDHADAEVNNRKWANDIMRASWIAELYIELRKNNGLELPPELLKSFTQHLFTPGAERGDAKHPYEALAEIATGATRIKASKDGIDLELGKPK